VNYIIALDISVMSVLVWEVCKFILADLRSRRLASKPRTVDALALATLYRRNRK